MATQAVAWCRTRQLTDEHADETSKALSGQTDTGFCRIPGSVALTEPPNFRMHPSPRSMFGRFLSMFGAGRVMRGVRRGLNNMLSKTVVEYWSSRVFRAEAQRTTWILPYCGICWDDELPEVRHLVSMTDEDRRAIFRLFIIRLSLWKGHTLDESDERFWDEAQNQVPEFALFQRMALSTDDRLAQDHCEREVAEELQSLWSHADEVSFFDNEHGEQSFSATFHLRGDEKCNAQEDRSWLRRLRWPFKGV